MLSTKVSKAVIRVTETTLNDRYNDLWLDDEGQKYAIILMYSVNQTSEPRFVRGGPYKSSVCEKKIEAMLNEWENGRAVCLNSHFINPKNIICIKADVWKSKNDRNTSDGGFYD